MFEILLTQTILYTYLENLEGVPYRFHFPQTALIFPDLGMPIRQKQ